MKLNRPCDLGIKVGANMARMTEPTIAKLAAAGDADERCPTCAFRAGTLPNGCLETVADAMKCGLSGEPFYCHDKHHAGQTCYGWFAMRHSLGGAEVAVPWPFSHEEDDSERARLPEPPSTASGLSPEAPEPDVQEGRNGSQAPQTPAGRLVNEAKE